MPETAAARRCSSSPIPSRLRVYVNVPQSYVPKIRIGTRAHMSVPEYPGRKFSATVEASAQAVDVGFGHDADAAGGRQCQRRTDDRRLRQCELRPAAPGRRDQCAGERADFRPERPARRDGRQRRTCRSQAGHDRARPRQGYRDRFRPHRRTIASSRARRMALHRAIKFASQAISDHRSGPVPARRPRRAEFSRSASTSSRIA